MPVAKAANPTPPPPPTQTERPARTPLPKATPIPPPRVEPILSTVMPSGRKYQAPREASVLRLALEGRKPKEIASELDMAIGTVYVHLSSLRGLGKLPSLRREGTESAPGERPRPATSTPTQSTPAQPAAGQAATRPSQAGSIPTPPAQVDTGQQTRAVTGISNADILRAEAARQCRENRTPAGPALFMTTIGGERKHAHRASVNRMGDGWTQADDSGHRHQVERFGVAVTDHGHVLLMP